MQLNLRSCATAGVALASVGLITATSVTTAGLPDVQVRAVQLTAGFDDLIDPYSHLFEHTFTNLESIGANWLANPAPFLTQVLTNQAGYAQTIAGTLQGGNFGDIFNALSDVPRGMAGNLLNVIQTLTSTSMDLNLDNLIGALPDWTSDPNAAFALIDYAVTHNTFGQFLEKTFEEVVGTAKLTMGLPLALGVDALGAPLLGATALLDSGTQFAAAVADLDPVTALSTLLTAPATITDAFLNGQGFNLLDMLGSLGLIDQGQFMEPFVMSILHAQLGKLSQTGADFTLPLGGLLAPLGHPEMGMDFAYSGAKNICWNLLNLCGGLFPKTISLSPYDFEISRTFEGTPFGGLVPALVNWMPQQLQDAISDPVTASWSDIATGYLELPNYLWDNFQLTSLFGADGWLGLLTSALGIDGLPGLGDLTGLFDLGGLIDPALLGGLLDPTLLGIDLVPNLIAALLGF